MSIEHFENAAFIKKNSTYKDIFTKNIKIHISENKGIIDVNINNIAHIFVKIPNQLLYLSKGGRKKTKRRKNASKKKTIKNKKQKGGGLKSMILLVLINYFLFNFIISIQIASNPQNRLDTEQQFFEENPLNHPEIRNLVDSVENISTVNNTGFSVKEVLQLVNTDGVVMQQPLPYISEDFDTAFVEVKYEEESATQKFIKLANMLPHIQRPTVSVMSFGLNARTRYYGLFAKWEIIDNNINVQLFNVTNKDGNYPDDRARNFPNDINLNTLAVETLKQQINTMVSTNLLRTGETNGFATIGAFNFPVYPSLIGSSHSFHQDGMPIITTRKNYSKEEDLEIKTKRSLGRPIFKNSTFSRTNIFDQVMTMSYPPKTNVRAGNRLHIINKDNETTTIPINVSSTESTTRMLQQNRGAQHSSRSQPMFNLNHLPKSRSALLVNVMPGEKFKVDPNLTYTARN